MATQPPQGAIHRASPHEATAVTAILEHAFMDDPISRWIFPNEVERAESHPDFFSVFVAATLEAGEIYVTDDHRGAALLLHTDPATPESPQERELFRALFRRTLTETAATRFLLLDTLMHDNHPGHAPHTYLPFIAVHPASQRLGLGTTLLAHVFNLLDAMGHSAYLEASSERNQRLYRRLGFTPIGSTVQIPGGPAFYPMWRKPSSPVLPRIPTAVRIPAQRRPKDQTND